MAQVIDGKAVAARVRAEVKAHVDRLRGEGLVPGLAVVRVGEDEASRIYVAGKKRAAEAAGLRSWEHHREASISQGELLALVERLNADPQVHGILVQLPLPKHIDAEAIVSAVRPDKDVDGLTPVSIGRLVLNRPGLRPCTPLGVMRLLEEIGYRPAGKRAVVVGRSNLVGKPVAMLLMHADATVTICHRKSDLPREVREADLVVAAAGFPELVQGAWVKPGAVVIDVGINRRADGKILGDVEYTTAAQHASYITPVPGGVGPMTIAMLLRNTVSAATAGRTL